MTFLVLLTALLLEQAWPLRRANPVHEAYKSFVERLKHHLDAGRYQHGVLAWLLAVAPLILAVFFIGYLLDHISPLLGWLWSIAVVYIAVGFRQFSHYFNQILLAMQDGNLQGARDLLARWRAEPCADLSSGEVACVSIELGLAESHRNVFGPIAWFVVLGPAGAILYRTVALLSEQWGRRREAQTAEGEAPGEFGSFAERAYYWVDWFPARLTALSFAAVGNFQDAVDCWRTQARAWADEAQGIVLASGAGALGVKLGGELHENDRLRYRPELGTGDGADIDYLRAAVGLIWRALVTWMFLMFIVTLAYSLG